MPVKLATVGSSGMPCCVNQIVYDGFGSTRAAMIAVRFTSSMLRFRDAVQKPSTLTKTRAIATNAVSVLRRVCRTRATATPKTTTMVMSAPRIT